MARVDFSSFGSTNYGVKKNVGLSSRVNMFSKERVQTFVQGKVKELWLIQSFAGALKKTKTMHTIFFKKTTRNYISLNRFLAIVIVLCGI